MWSTISATSLGILGGVTYTLILLNPGFKFSKLGVSGKDFAWAVAINAFLGGVAGFVGWTFGFGQIGLPKAYGVYLLCGVGGGSFIQNWTLTLGKIESRTTLDRALEAVEALSRAQTGSDASEIGNLSRALRSETDRQQRLVISRQLVESAKRVSAQSSV